MFSGLRNNSLFYILEKGEVPTLKVGQVVSVSNPQPKYNQFPAPTYGAQPETFVDIKVQVGEETMEFKQLPSTQSIHGNNGVVVSDSKEAMSAEVEAQIRTSRQILDSVPYHEKTLVACDAMLRELNPHFAKEKAQEEKIGALEDKMGNIESTLGDMMSMLSGLVNKTSKSKAKED